MTALGTPHAPSVASPPLSRAIQWGVGLCLVLGGLLNGGSQYAGELLTRGQETFGDQIRWGVDHPAIHQSEQFALVLSMLVLPLGLLGLAQVTRWSAPRLTAVATVLMLIGMWGFQNVVALGYTAGSVAPGSIGIDDAVELNDELVEHTGVLVNALFPHLIGSFLGLLLLSIACWRSGVFPKVPLVALIAFLVWDFTLPSVGVFEAHVLLLLALVWLGIHVIRMPRRTWLNGSSDGVQSREHTEA